MALTLAELRTPEAVADIRARLITNLTGAGLPVASWAPSSAGGVENIRADMAAGTIAEMISVRSAKLVELTLLELATGDRLTYLAAKRYKIPRDEATYTIQNIALWMVGAPSAKTFGVGELVVKSQATGNRYRNIEAVSLTPDSTVLAPAMVSFQAENPGSSYSDPAGTIAQMVTAPAGVRCISVRPGAFTEAKVTGASTGRITADYSVADVPPEYGSVRVRIDTSGEVGVATWSYSTDGGAHWTSVGVMHASHSIPGGTTLFFANGAAPSFIIGNIYTLLVADAILQRGADQEAAEALRTRCRSRWASLSDVVTESVIDLWAHLASPEVDKVSADADPSTPGSTLVRISSASGPASAVAVIAVQDYVTARLRGFKGVPGTDDFPSPEERVLVTSATKREITPYAVVTVPADTVATVQAAAEAAWVEYLRTIPLGGSPFATVILEKLEQIVMNAGAVDILGATLNGDDDDLDLEDGEKAVPADGTTLLTALVWSPDPAGVGTPIDEDEEDDEEIAAAPTLTTIMAPPTSEEVGAELLSYLGTSKNPVTDWESGAVLRTMYEIEKEVCTDLVANAMMVVAEGGFADTGEGDWLTDLAHAFYDVDRSPSAIAQQSVTLACVAGKGPYTITVDQFVMQATDGSRYFAATGGTLNPADTLAIEARAESPGAARGLISTVVTPLEGVTVQSAAIRVISTVSQFGADEESGPALRERCDDRWPDLEEVPAIDRVEKWALASHEDVTRVRLDPHPLYPGGVEVTVAGEAGAVDSGVVTAAGDYVTKRDAITDFSLAQNAINLTIDVTGTVYVGEASLADAQERADAAWLAYLAGSKIGGKVLRSELHRVLTNAGAFDIDDVVITGADIDGAVNKELATAEVPVAGDLLSVQLTWVTV